MGYKKANRVTLTGGFTTTNPNDATNYYFGTVPAASLTTVDTTYQFIIPYDGIIEGVQLYTNATAAGTNENWEWNIRKNATTNYSIGTVGIADNMRVWNTYAGTFTPIPVNKSDAILLHTLTPNWVTNPTGVKGICLIYLVG